MQTIPLTQNKIALVSDGDYPLLMQWKWTYLDNGRSGYAVRWEKRRTIYMHRQIMQAAAGQVIDHEDGNGLNNQRENLRVCNTSLNQVNRATQQRAIPYRGVHRSKQTDRPWKAQIKAQRRVYHLGAFATQEEAARIYDRAALHFFGSFARLNFPGEIEVTRMLPLARTIVRMLEAPQQLTLDLETTEELPDLEVSVSMSRSEARIMQQWRATRIPTPAGIDDDLL